MYGSEILDLFHILGPFSLGATAESWTQDGCRRNHGHKMAAGATVFRDTLIPGIPAGVHEDVTDMKLSQTAESSATALYP